MEKKEPLLSAFEITLLGVMTVGIGTISIGALVLYNRYLTTTNVMMSGMIDDTLEAITTSLNPQTK